MGPVVAEDLLHRVLDAHDLFLDLGLGLHREIDVMDRVRRQLVPLGDDALDQVLRHGLPLSTLV